MSLARLLMEQSDFLLQEVFTSSAALSILPGVLKCLLAAASEIPQAVTHMLEVIGSSDNFDLTAMFLSDMEKVLIGQVFVTLEKVTGQPINPSLRKHWIPG